MADRIPAHPGLISPQTDRQFRQLLGLSLTKAPALPPLRRLLREDRAAANRAQYETTVVAEARRQHGRAMKWIIDAEIVTLPAELLED